MPPALILMIKNPIPGKTKTRLAASVGNDMALKMYGILLDWTRAQADGLGDEVHRYLYYSSEIVADDDWSDERYTKRLQSGKDLGERMENAFRECFAAGHDRVVIIGSDCPGITTDYLRTAFAALYENDLVIGPAVDGGYTLLGSNTLQGFLFREMVWSTETVLTETLARAEEKVLSVRKLPALIDVDHLEDWQSYGWTVPN